MKAAAAGGAGEFWRRKKNFHNLSKEEEASVRIETSLGDGGLEGAEPGENAQLSWGNVFHHHLSASICINYDSAPSGGADVQTDSEDGETKHSPAVTHMLQNTQTGSQAADSPQQPASIGSWDQSGVEAPQVFGGTTASQTLTVQKRREGEMGRQQ